MQFFGRIAPPPVAISYPVTLMSTSSRAKKETESLVSGGTSPDERLSRPRSLRDDMELDRHLAAVRRAERDGYRYPRLVSRCTGITGFVYALNREPNHDERAGASGSLTWMRLGACATSGDAVGFFSDHGGSNASAKRVCARCAVRVDCLGYALRH